MDAALCAVIHKMSYFPKEEPKTNPIFPFKVGDNVRWNPQKKELLIQKFAPDPIPPSDYPLRGARVIQIYPATNLIRLWWIDDTTDLGHDKTWNANLFVVDYARAFEEKQAEAKQAEASNFLAGSLRF